MAYSPQGLGSPTMVLFTLESLRNYCTGYKTDAPAVPIWHGGSEGVREDHSYSIQNICLLVLSRSNILVIYINQKTKRENVATNKFSNHWTTINNSENKEGNITASWKLHSRKRSVPRTVLCPSSRDKQICCLWGLTHDCLLAATRHGGRDKCVLSRGRKDGKASVFSHISPRGFSSSSL